MRLHRLIAILLIVESRGIIKAKDLAEALETSKRTIYRDIDTLCEAGIPLTTISGPNGGIAFIEGYSINLNQLYGDEVINLYFTGIGIHPKDQNEAQIKLQTALLKLEKSLPEDYKLDIKKAKNRFYYDETPWWGEIKKIKNLEIIRKAVWQSRILKINYKKFNQELSSRTIYPYGLIVKQLDWYLVANDQNSNEVRIFKCERIVEAKVLEQDFLIPEDFNLEIFWKESSKHFKLGRIEDEYYQVIIKLNKFNDFILKSLDVIDTKIENDIIFATINMHTFNFACSEALEIAGVCEIIHPTTLRNFIKIELMKLLKEYEKGL